jgi:hypothetical protein
MCRTTARNAGRFVDLNHAPDWRRFGPEGGFAELLKLFVLTVVFVFGISAALCKAMMNSQCRRTFGIAFILLDAFNRRPLPNFELSLTLCGRRSILLLDEYCRMVVAKFVMAGPNA